MRAFDEREVLDLLMQSWSNQTARQWTPHNPAAGQCNVTAALVFDLYGGEILRTPLPDGDHFYNRIDGQVFDLTRHQFSSSPEYLDLPATREEAMAVVTSEEYDALRSGVLALDEDRRSEDPGSEDPGSEHEG